MKKLTREFAATQAKRLQACAMLVPNSDAGRKEFVDCMMRHCVSEEHCAATMTELLDDATKIQNLTAEFAGIARKLRPADADAAPPGCAACEVGEDLNGVMQWALHVSGTLPSGTTFAKRCNCERGRWLTAKDAERGAEAPKKPARPKAMRRVERADVRARAAGERE